MTNTEIIIASIKTVINGELIKNPPSLNEADYEEIYKIARSHDLLPIVSEGLYRNNLLPDNETGEAFKKAQMIAMVRFYHFEQERTKIAKVFKENNIEYIFLKGSVIKDYYPEAYMRTQCDIDVLVKQDDLLRAEEVLKESGYKKTSIEHHEISFYSQTGVHIELHFFLEEEHSEVIDEALLLVWDNVYSEVDNQYQHYMNDGFFLFYHVAHLEKHFLNGGCGIKPLIDLWIIKHRMGISVEDSRTLLKKCNLLTFFQHVEFLSEVWFGNMPHTKTSKKIEKYILDAGVYGTMENCVAMAQVMKGSKFKYILRRFILPYKTMSEFYPMVKKYPVILPFAHIYRWCKVLFGKERKRALDEVKLNLNTNEEKRREMMNLYKKLHL